MGPRQQTGEAVFREELPRVHEIIDRIPKGSPLMARFPRFDKLLSEESGARKEFLSQEGLEEVDTASWDHLKKEVAQLLMDEDGEDGMAADHGQNTQRSKRLRIFGRHRMQRNQSRPSWPKADSRLAGSVGR